MRNLKPLLGIFAVDKQGQGFLTFAQNTDSVDYLKLAYVQAMNIKTLHPAAEYAVLVDAETSKLVTGKHRRVFDHVILITNDNNPAESTWKLANEYQVFNLTPFKETIKLESDLLFTRNIDHWWSTFRLRDIVLSYNCKDYRGINNASQAYRQLFIDNQLPNTYSGLMYFRYSKDANNFFYLAQQLYENWTYIKNNVLIKCHEDFPSTDVLYALTAKIIGVEKCTLPHIDFVNFVHMKSAINGWGFNDSDWRDIVVSEQDDTMIRINNINQYYPVHYHNKNYVTEELIDYYERLLF